MSDYLTGVVSRALNLEPVVRPVVPSIFETGTSPEAPEVNVTADVKPRTMTQREAPEQANRPAREIPSEPAAAAPPVTEHRVERETVHELSREAPVTPGLRTERQHDIVELATVVERHTRELRQTELRELVVETISPPGAPVKLSVADATRPNDSMAPRNIVPVANPVIRAADRGSAREPDEAPATERAAVRVTIGRVEVRAVFPATPAASTPKPKLTPVMPLEEYLKQGNRRGR